MTHPSHPSHPSHSSGAPRNDPWSALPPRTLSPGPGTPPRDAGERVYQVGHHQVSISDKHRRYSPETYRLGGIGALIGLILVGSGIGSFPFFGTLFFLALLTGGILTNRHFRLVARALEIERSGHTSGPTLRQLNNGAPVMPPTPAGPPAPSAHRAQAAPRYSVPLQGVAEAPYAFDLPRDAPLHGEIVPAPGLRHGQNALKVLVSGKKVGYLAAEAADHYAPVLARYRVSRYPVVVWLGGTTGEDGVAELPVPAQLDAEFQGNWRR